MKDILEEVQRLVRVGGRQGTAVTANGAGSTSRTDVSSVN